jgi:hypothetical protein
MADDLGADLGWSATTVPPGGSQDLHEVAEVVGGRMELKRTASAKEGQAHGNLRWICFLLAEERFMDVLRVNFPYRWG